MTMSSGPQIAGISSSRTQYPQSTSYNIMQRVNDPSTHGSGGNKSTLS